jgi:hypothetical protein
MMSSSSTAKTGRRRKQLCGIGSLLTKQNGVFPLTFVLHDGSFEDSIWADYPPVPWLMKLVLRYLVIGKRSNLWRFAPCDYYSQPQVLPFA